MTDATILTAWAAPAASGPLDAVVTLPGSKSLTARALVLAALADAPSTLLGALRSRDTDLMLDALHVLGVGSEVLDDSGSKLRIFPATEPLPVTAQGGEPPQVDCGLAGTVMRFVPPLAALAQRPVVFDGDEAARLRPLGPVLDALAALGAAVSELGAPGHLPVRVGPGSGALLRPADPANPTAPHRVSIDASQSSQFLSALLLVGALLPGGLEITSTGPVPSLPHIHMTVESLRERGIVVDEPDPQAPEAARSWRVHPGRPHGGEVLIEPDLSNAGPFLAAALICGGSVTVPHWPAHTTQAGAAWRKLLPQLGGTVTTTAQPDGTLRFTAHGTGQLTGIDADLSAVGELAPTVAALCVLAAAQGHASRLTGIAHLRGHETNRLAALVAEINRLGASARETTDGLDIEALPAGAQLHPTRLHTYADHRLATFAALIALAVPGTTLDDVACTSKTLPDFPTMWSAMLATGASTPTTAKPTTEDCC
ncbi:3-phosphoshikimate 1-carboxyvinyltransferase [Actinomyces bovis]|uniref:3-phosphoshikimate 1-carboxyvinyltransferase n=1 Tax=Actinomyces bovis TaxID=1658 RepID=A0ABY1VMP9_9ACTO|nr:3-phosphoshikimate 1-carboxyvinyltransferase [Actinomyces bovis]SPT53370.1 3-phosphoshikimate 1-carboxyvinyltransferase [Actinomyces bovis]VEG52756.1 3-phosphoshikimate 1-carboxyvinyltransferase [Actinomyces israelii]